MTKRPNKGREARYFTFEWVCSDLECACKGQVHRRRVRAGSPEKARKLAASMGIPNLAKIVEEEEERIMQKLVW